MDMKPTQEQLSEWVQTAENLTAALTLAYKAGRKDENEACQEICNRHRETIAGVIHHAIRARREQ